MCKWIIPAILLIAGSPASAQSYNIEFGATGTAPPDSYGAAGQAGVWNTFEVLPSGVTFPLVNTDGLSAGATIRNIGGTQLLASDDPATRGDDALLMDDMLIGFNDPVDVCIFMNGFPNGRYVVLIYAMTPNDSDLLSRTRVDFADQGPAFIGGAWPGGYQIGITHSRHTINVTNGRIDLHSGEFGALVQSGINGIQIRPIPPADINEDGTVDGLDLGVLLANWSIPAGSPGCGGAAPCASDLNADGVVDGLDLGVLLAGWTL